MWEFVRKEYKHIQNTLLVRIELPSNHYLLKITLWFSTKHSIHNSISNSSRKGNPRTRTIRQPCWAGLPWEAGLNINHTIATRQPIVLVGQPVVPVGLDSRPVVVCFFCCLVCFLMLQQTNQTAATKINVKFDHDYVTAGLDHVCLLLPA